jgi:undecaprenyl-diphosphatase
MPPDLPAPVVPPGRAETRAPRHRQIVVALALGVAVLAGWVGSAHAATAVVARARASSSSDTPNELNVPKAIVLGLVEGVTEFLPVSSTGHLLVVERAMGIGQTPETKDAADTYAVTIQAGAIMAVVLLYHRRLRSMVEGVLGRDPQGRTVAVAVLIAFIPAAVVGVVFEKPIRNHLLGVWPVIIAWTVGGILLLVFGDRRHDQEERHRPGLESITVRQALLVGAAQVLALWPGTSRSLVTIIAALAVGLSLSAAIEFSFLLGLLTVTAATAYGLLRHGNDLLDAYGVINPLIGVAVAFVSAVVAVRWMVTYLQRHSLAIFGWYRLAVAALTIGLLATGVI